MFSLQGVGLVVKTWNLRVQDLGTWEFVCKSTLPKWVRYHSQHENRPRNGSFVNVALTEQGKTNNKEPHLPVADLTEDQTLVRSHNQL